MTNGPFDLPAPNTSATSLEYGRQRSNWLRRHWKLLFLIICATAVLIPCYKHRVTLLARANWIYWSKRAASHSMPAASVPLLHRVSVSGTVESDYVVLRHARATTPPVAAYAPAAYRRLLDIDPRLYEFAPGFVPVEVAPLVYMGTVYRPDGTPRLVIITGTGGYRPLEGLKVAVLPVASLLDPPPSKPATRGRTEIVWTILCGPPPRPVELHSGVLDPLNHPRIVLHFVVGDDFVGEPLVSTDRIVGEGDLEVRLQDDDAVKVIVRSAPKGIGVDVYGPNW
jgi:hypothetical protein